MMDVAEVQYIRTNDGEYNYMTSNDLKLLLFGGYGAPPTEFVIRKGYKQHGVEELSYFLQPRPMTLNIYSGPGCRRQDYWDAREFLINVFRQNRGGKATLFVRLPNGDIRAIDFMGDPGFIFPAEIDRNAWFVQEDIAIIAHDPVWFNPVSTEIELTDYTGDENLVFPIEFPIMFGSDRVLSSGEIIYNGTWQSFLQVYVYGPYDRALITNQGNGSYVYLTVPTVQGELRAVDIRSGNRSVKDIFGRSMFDNLGVGSDMIDLPLAPHPEVENGTQRIEVMFWGSTEDSRARVVYNERYFGL